MAFVLETGEGLQFANSYVSEAMANTYWDDRGYTLAAGDPQTALVRGTQYVDTYRFRFPGYRTKRRLQGLEWPRVGAYTNLSSDGREYPYPNALFRTDSFQQYLGYSFIPSNEIPVEIIQATCEAALRELAVPGSMQPDLERGGMVKSLAAGSVSIVYMDGATPQSTTQLIDGILSGLLLNTAGGWMAASARG